MDVKHLVKIAGGFLEKNSPQILTGLGVAGLVSTAVMTGRATAKACDICREKEQVLFSSSDPDSLEQFNQFQEHPWLEKTKWTWKCYIPPFLMGASSIACILGAQSVNTKRNAALASLYSLTKTSLEDYQEKVKERFGEKKEELVRGDVAQKKLDEKPVFNEYIIETGKGKSLCYDNLSGRYFRADLEVIRRIVNDLNHDLLGIMWVPLNDFYYALGLEGIKVGDDLGWTVDELIDLKVTSKVTPDGEPCLVIDYDITSRGLKSRNWSGL